MKYAEEKIYRDVVAEIGRQTPRGAGFWDGCIDYVREPDNEFRAAVDQWSQDDTESTRERVQDAARDLIAGWKLAGGAWVGEGSPLDGMPEPEPTGTGA